MKTTEEVLVIAKDGKYWGIEYQDGHCTQYGWLGDIELAEQHLIYEGQNQTDPTRFVRPNLKDEVKGAKMLKLSIETTYTLQED